MKSAQKIIQKIPEHWHLTLLSGFIVTLLSAMFFYETWSSIFEIWVRSDTFAHGFLIIPISLWLVWTKKDYYKQLKPNISWSVILIILSCGLIWMIADLTQVQVIRQYAVVALLISALWMLLGNRVSLKMMMPLGFLFFMVPIGEGLIPPLMNYTANFTVWMLRLTGLSVYREGLYFTLTSGNWSVVEGCSGLRYLIASITLGFVYAYLTYNSFWKRSVFVLLSIIVPIIANGFRAYMIVMIAHFSDMKLALGVDHYIYGGVFFGLVMLLLFFLGSFWRDPPLEPMLRVDGTEGARATKSNQQQLIVLLVLISASFAVWPVISDWLKGQQFNRSDINQNFSMIHSLGWDSTEDPMWQWKAEFNDATAESYRYFSNGQYILGIFQASFGNELQGGGELVNSQNLIVRQKHKYWKIIENAPVKLKTNHSVETVDVFTLRSQDRDLLLFRWYQIGEKATANKYLAKFYQLIKLLTADTSQQMQVIFFMELPFNQQDKTRALLKKVAETWMGTYG